MSEIVRQWRAPRREMFWLVCNRVTLPAVLRIETGLTAEVGSEPREHYGEMSRSSEVSVDARTMI